MTKKAVLLGFLLLSVVVVPSVSHAQYSYSSGYGMSGMSYSYPPSYNSYSYNYSYPASYSYTGTPMYTNNTYYPSSYSPTAAYPYYDPNNVYVSFPNYYNYRPYMSSINSVYASRPYVLNSRYSYKHMTYRPYYPSYYQPCSQWSNCAWMY